MKPISPIHIHFVKKIIPVTFFLILIHILPLEGCVSSITPAPTLDPTRLFQQALLTATYSIVQSPQSQVSITTPTVSPSPTPTQIPPTPQLTPPALPSIFETTLLNPFDKPNTYIQDTCQYLKMRWDPNNSPPGTVVMPIMFHSVTDGDVVHNDQITVTFFRQLMENLKSQGFQTITTQQLADFLEHNERIPKRSMILIVDDRKRAQYFEVLFKPYFETDGWTVTNAWISAPDTPDYLWKENEGLAKAGWVDFQAHGVIHNIPISNNSTDDFIQNELDGSINAIEHHFGKKPIAFIWPGGGFTPKAAQMARQAGFRLGFTINPRGPLMFNWIPLSDQVDPSRPSYIPESGIGDPLMVLPRYWDTDASLHIDEVRQMGKEAAAQAELTKAAELEYYKIVCKPITGDIPNR